MLFWKAYHNIHLENYVKALLQKILPRKIFTC